MRIAALKGPDLRRPRRVGSVKTPIEVWDDLPRSKVGKVLKSEIRARMLGNGKTWRWLRKYS
jgi:acyl-CoA synthetase (AMP-forming)/AMP-acid ligase II